MMTGLLAANTRGGGANTSSLDELASRHAAATFREWVELLAIPNVATVGADIQQNVAWLERAFQPRGFRTQQLANDDKPMLLAELPGAAADRRTVLFYAHPPHQGDREGQHCIPSSAPVAGRSTLTLSAA
jgi:hypothetical protein